MKNKRLIYIFMGFIIIALLVLVIFLINDKRNETKKDYEEFIFTTNDALNDVKEVSSGYKITLNNNYPLKIYDFIDDTETYKNITISGFKLDNIESTLYLENITSTANCIQDEKYPKIILNGTVIEEFSNEACYLISPGEIFVIEEKYIGIIYYILENLEYSLAIYNKEGEREYLRDIVDFDLESFTFKDYEETNYYINEYKLAKRNGKIEDILVKNGTEQFCDMINGIGVCEE